MELTLISLLMGTASLVLAIIALGSGPSRRRVDMLSQELAELRLRLLRSGALPPPPSPILVRSQALEGSMPVPAPSTVPVRTAEPVIAAPQTLFPSPLGPVEAPLPYVVPAAAPSLAYVEQPPAPVAPPLAYVQPAPPPVSPVQVEPVASFEERVALVWFTRIGALILLIGVGFFYNYAVDSGWLEPTARLLLGAGTGLAILAGSELLRARTKPIFLNVMTGAGLGILYLVAWASHVRYGVTPSTVAFAAFGAITLLGGVFAVRQRAELVLMFALVGGFLAPVLLSSGADRPLELFAYLVVLSSLALSVSARLGFAIAPWIAIGGVVTLTIGWFATRFDGNPRYADLIARWPAFVGTAAVVIAWLRSAREIHSRQLGASGPALALGLTLAALTFAHGCTGVLLHDAPLALGAVTTALAVLGVVTLRSRREWISLPMVAASIAIACVDPSDPTGALHAIAGLAGAMVVYVVGALGDQLGRGRVPDRTTLFGVTSASAALALVAAILLLERQPHAFALVLLVLSLAHAALAIATAQPRLVLSANAAAVVGFVAVLGQLDGGEAGSSAIIGAWAAIHLAFGAYELIGKRVVLSDGRVASISLAAIALPLLTWPALHDQAAFAVVPALAGIALLAFGTRLLPDTRSHASILLAEGVGLVAFAVAVQFSDATTMAVWAVIAAVIVALAAAAKDARWLAGGGAVFTLVLFALPGELDTTGRFLLDPRCAALAITSAALLWSARRTSRVDEPSFRLATPLLAIAGHAVVLALLITETAGLVVDPAREMMAITLVLGLYAALLLGIGFGARNPLHRYLGLGLFTLTIGKLALVDIWTLERVYQMVIFLGIGALLVAAGFLYARFGRRLFALLRDTGG